MLRPTSLCTLLWSTIALAATVASAEQSTRLALVRGMLLDGYGGVPVHQLYRSAERVPPVPPAAVPDQR